MTGSVRTCCGCRTQVPDGDEHLHSARTRAMNGLLGFLSIKGVRRTGPVSWTIYFGRDSRVVASCPALVQEGA